MKVLRNILLAMILVSSCGKQVSPLVTVLVPQIVSTEVFPGTDAVTLYASVAGSANFTDCGFGLVKDGLIREYPARLDRETLSFSAVPDGLDPDSNYGFYAFLANGSSRIQTPERAFRTLASDSPGPEAPSVGFVSVSAVPGTRSAVLFATLRETEGVSATGFSVSADGLTYTDIPANLSGEGISYTWGGLEPDTAYSFLAWAEQRGRRVSSGKVDFRTEAEVHGISFTEVVATPQAFSVVLCAAVDDGSHVSYCGFGLSRDGRTPVEYASSISNNTFSVEVGDLLPDTEYVCYAFVTLDGKRVTSGFVSFRTAEDPTLHILETGAEAAVTSVRLSARLSRTDDVTEAGFGLASDGDAFIEKDAEIKSDGRISILWEGLEADSHYRFYVYAISGGGRTVSHTLEFYTHKAPSTDVEFVSVSAEPSGNAVTLIATLTGTDGISDYGFGLSPNGYDYVEYSALPTAGGFSKTIDNLSPGTTYYYYAFFTLNGSFRQSEILSFQIP